MRPKARVQLGPWGHHGPGGGRPKDPRHLPPPAPLSIFSFSARFCWAQFGSSALLVTGRDQGKGL